jgi:signal peptidase
VVVDAVLVALACVAVLLAAGSIYMISTNGAGGIFGYSVEVVASGSMAPTIATGDLIVVKEQSSYKVGDVVTFRDSSGNLVTHRIIAEGDDGAFTTKGDANNVADRSSVNTSDIVGSLVFVVPGGEVFVSFAQQPAVIGTLVFILVLLIFFPAINKVRTKG